MSTTIVRAGLFAMLSVSVAAQAQNATKVVPPQQKVLSSENGRYVFGQISEKHEDQYVLDTATGRVWRKVIATVTKDGEPNEVEVFQPVPYEGQDRQWLLMPR
jgi:hypothetical protein